MAEVWYTVHLLGSGGEPRTIDTLATSKLQAEVAVIKQADEDWPHGSPWSCTKSERSR